MTQIFQNQTEHYDGLAEEDETVGEGAVLVDYHVSEPNRSTLKIMGRKESSNVDYKALKVLTDSDMFVFSATGIQYYFEWKPLNNSADNPVTATLDA